MSAPPLVRVRGLARTYAVGDVRVAALEDVSLDIGEGRFVAVTGASGSGKSTLLNLLGGLDTPTAGAIEVGGVPVSGMDREALARYRRTVAGMIFQSFNLVPARTALENVELPLVFAGVERAERRRRAAALLEQVGLARRGGHRPAELSGGEQQRVAVARALANGPEVLFLDEVMAGLNTDETRQMISMVKAIAKERGLAVGVVEHVMGVIRELTERVIVLESGELIAEGPYSEVSKNPRVIEAYLGGAA